MYNISKYDYERISFRPNSDHDSFKILTGQYAGVIVTYGKLALEELKEFASDETKGRLSFEYQIEQSPMESLELTESAAFENYIGDMLTQIIEESLDDGNYKIGKAK